MRKFLKSLVVFILPIIVLLFTLIYVKVNSMNGRTDPFYLRFTSPKQSSLILGTSRAAQGILPSVLNKELNRNDFYNYSFTIVHSPYGEVYYESIKKKLNKNTKNGIFILAVDPWSLSENNNTVQEADLCVGKITNVNSDPNFHYLFLYRDELFKNLFKKPINSGMLLHEDGWLEIFASMDSVTVSNRILNKEKEYLNNNLPSYKFSEKRWFYFNKIIQLLEQYGSVFLVRLPVHEKIFKIDETLMPDFDYKIRKLSAESQTPYIDLNIQDTLKLQFVDGNHLYKESAAEVSKQIAHWISSIN